MNPSTPPPVTAPAAAPATVTVTVSFATPSGAAATQVVNIPLAPPVGAPASEAAAPVAIPTSGTTAAPTTVPGQAPSPAPEPAAAPATQPTDAAKATTSPAATPPKARTSETGAGAGPTPAKTGAVPAAAAAVPQTRLQRAKRWLIPAIIIAVLALAALTAWQMLRPKGPGEGFVSSNGRIEATEIDVSSKFSGRLQDLLVNDGDFVAAGQTLGHMQVQSLEAQRDEASSKHQQSITAVASAQAAVAQRESDRQAVLALVAQRASELDAAQRRLARSETLTKEGASSGQELDDDRARVRTAQAAVVAAKAQVQAAIAAISAAQAQVAGTHASVDAAAATIARIKVDIDDSALTAPRAGRVQYRVAQPGEVLAAGGKVLNLVDLGDVYMTFFGPETAAGKLALGSEVHIILDAAPQYVIPAKVAFVASTAQFTPKTVETASERQKLMFRVKAQIGRDLLQKNLTQVKTGLPGIAWIKLDGDAKWPAELAVKVPR